MQTDLRVGEYTESDENGIAEEHQWQREFQAHEVLVMTADLFLLIITKGYFSLSQVNLLILDECHHAAKSHPYATIMECYDACLAETCPRILGLTTSLLTKQCHSPEHLQESLTSLETALRGRAEIAATTGVVDVFGIKPKEVVVRCKEYDDSTGLVSHFGDMLWETLDFLYSCDGDAAEDDNGLDHRVTAKALLLECVNVLHILGPWCAGFVAGAMCNYLKKLMQQDTDEEVNLQYLGLAMTQLHKIDHIMNLVYNTCVQTLEDFLELMSPKVLSLLELLREFKPDDNFIILGGDDYMDAGTDSDSDDDMLDLDQDYEDSMEEGKSDSGKGNKPYVHYVAIKRTQAVDQEEKEKDSLYGLVFVERPHTAVALNGLIVELCNWDPDIFFVQSHHMMRKGKHRKNGGQDTWDTQLLLKEQEQIMEKFRQRELNLLVCTNVLEDGVDVPKCNFVVRFDLPSDYHSYVQSKVCIVIFRFFF